MRVNRKSNWKIKKKQSEKVANDKLILRETMRELVNVWFKQTESGVFLKLQSTM